MPRFANARGVKSRWNYTVAEIAALLGVHRNTVRQWVKDGLPLATERKPFLVCGSDLRSYLDRRRANRKQPLGCGEIYCVACHAPKRPAGDMADYLPRNAASGSLLGLCPDCGRFIRRAVSMVKLGEVASGLNLTIAGGFATLRNVEAPSVNSDFSGEQE